MITAKQTAVTGVKIGMIPVKDGTKMPIEPSISEIPIKRMKGIASPSTPVCLCATSHRSDCVDFATPEYKKIIARNSWQIQIAVFITYYFEHKTPKHNGWFF